MDQAQRDAILIRVDERTAGLAKDLATHMENDRTDFKEVHSRVNRISGKQNWILGACSLVVVVVGAVGTWLRSS